MHARPEEEAYAAYDRRQTWLFADSQVHGPAVLWALEQEHDVMLTAEVMRHQRLTEKIQDTVTHLAQLRDLLHDMQADLMVSTHALTRANAYK